MNLKNIFTYKDFLNEKNQYAVYVDGKQYGAEGDYKSGRNNYQSAIVKSEPGTKVELYKVEDSKGNKIKELKKFQTIERKEIRKTTLKDVKETIQQQLLDLFHKVNLGSAYLIQDNKEKKLNNINEGDIEINEEFDIKFDVCPMDFSHGTQISKEFQNSLKFNKEFNEGVSQKKPYLLVISDIKNEDGISVFFEDIENIKRKYNKGEDLTEDEKKLILKLKTASNIISHGSEEEKFTRDKDFTLIYTIKLVNNPDFGKKSYEVDDEDYKSTQIEEPEEQEEPENIENLDDIDDVFRDEENLDDINDEDLPY